MQTSTPSCLLKILIVEDSASIAGRLKRMLNDLLTSECIEVAENLTSARQVLSMSVPDVVILDIHLQGEEPGVTGMDLLKIVRDKSKNTTVMMFTNYSDKQYRERCMQLGADYFFDKSTDFEKVPETIKMISDKRNNIIH
ncbi:MAG: response regulator [Chitinophagales bacterium]|nr:response regulator [Chitinophagales bacterium]